MTHGDWAFTADGRIFVPDRRLQPDPAYSYLALRGYSATRAVIVDGACIGWVHVDDLNPKDPPMDKFTTTAGSLQRGDRIGRPDRAPVRYSTLSDSCAAYLVYVDGEGFPRRYGRQEPLTVFRPRK